MRGVLHRLGLRACPHGSIMWCPDCLDFVALSIALTVGILFGAGCHPLPPPDPVPVPPGPPVIGAACADYCVHALELGCPAALPTPGGASCEEVCLNVQTSGVLLWDLDCRAAAPSCEAIDRCDR